MGYLMGIDQGGSKTAAVVSDSKGNLLGLGRSEGSCYATRGMEHAMEHILKACNEALVQAGVTLAEVELVVAGLTGADWPYEYALLKEELQKRLRLARVTVHNDSVIAMRGGTEASHGAAICAGSALNVCIRSPQGEEYAFGYYIDPDYHGGGALGNTALRAVFAAEAGIAAPTALKEAILQYYGLETVEELLMKYSSSQLPGNVMDLAPLLFRQANAGDGTAQDILMRFGAGTAAYVAAGLKKFGMEALPCDVVLTGSVFKSHNEALLQAISATLHAAAPKARLVDACYEPVVGAVLLGLDSLHGVGRNLRAMIRENILKTSTTLKLLRKKEG